MVKIFTFCLYDGSRNSKNLSFQEYLKGFLKNCQLINEHFPNFVIILNAEYKLKQIIDQCNDIKNNPTIIVKYSENDNDIMFDSFVIHRLDVFMDPYEIVIVRDADQILTKLDIFLLKQWIEDPNNKYLIYFFCSRIDDKYFHGICAGGFATKDPKFGEFFKSDKHELQIKNIMEDIKKIDSGTFGIRIDEDLIWRYLGFLNIIRQTNDKKFYIDPDLNITYLITNKITNKKYNIQGSNLTLIDITM